LENPVPTFCNLRMNLTGAKGLEIPGALYGKVVGTLPGNGTEVSIRFTSMSPEIETFRRGLLA
jgi:hypothetical protein